MNELERAWRDYQTRVEEYAEKRFHGLIETYLTMHDLQMIVGNGTWIIWGKDGKSLYPEDLPKSIREVLDMEVPGMPGNCLGSLMPERRTK